MSFFRVPEKWDAEAEVIVVGAGTAGLPAALRAAEKGATVMVLEAWSGLRHGAGGLERPGQQLSLYRRRHTLHGDRCAKSSRY